MRKNLLLLLITVSFFSMNVYADNMGGSSTWNASIRAVGQDLGAVNRYVTTIGVGRVAEMLDAPPAPPEYSVKMELLGGGASYLARDIRQMNPERKLWVICIDPQGNLKPPSSGSAILSWDPREFGAGDFELRRGDSGSGEIVIPDMKAITSYEVQDNGVQYLTIVFNPNEN